MKLTDAIVAKLELPPGKTEHFVWDDDLPGFGCRLREGGSKRWVVQYRANRKQRRESLGDVRRLKLEAARKVARNIFARVELGQDPAADRARARAESVADKLRYGLVVDRYLAAKADQIRPTTYEATDRYLRQYFGGLRNMPIGTIKRADIAVVLTEITTTRGRVAAARARAHLSSLFSWAIREGFLDSNPVGRHQRPCTRHRGARSHPG